MSLAISGAGCPKRFQLSTISFNPQPAFSLNPIRRNAVAIVGFRSSFGPGSFNAPGTKASPGFQKTVRSEKCRISGLRV